jgi:hypothetical protein
MRKDGATRERDALYGSGDRDCEERDLGIVALGLPTTRLLDLVPRNCDASVLSVARGDEYGRPVEEESVSGPMIWRSIHEAMQICDHEQVEGLEVLKVEPDGLVVPKEREGMSTGDGRKGGTDL